MDHAFDPIPDMGLAIDQLGLKNAPYLLKFGEAKWLKASLEHGQFRIGSASYYDSVTLNHARRDTELERFVNPNPRSPARAALSQLAGRNDAAQKPGWFSIKYRTDYFLFSLSARYSARLFGDFAATACLIIHNPDVFRERMEQALRATEPYLTK